MLTSFGCKRSPFVRHAFNQIKQISSNSCTLQRTSRIGCHKRVLAISQSLTIMQPNPRLFPNSVTMSTLRSSNAEGTDRALAELDLEYGSGLVALDGRADDPSQLIFINLYPGSSDPVLRQILEATSIEQVFSTFESMYNAGEVNATHSSQALATVLDLQKLVFNVGSLFGAKREDLPSRRSFVSELSKHPTFQKILQHILDNLKQLEDEPLAACLLCLKKFEFDIRSNSCQSILKELDVRGHKLSLPAVSRICVALRNEGIYGSLIITTLFTRLCEFIKEMDNGHDLRLVSIALRNASRCLTPSITQLYYNKLESLLRGGQLSDLDPSIYCKVLLCLNDTKWIRFNGHEEAQRIREGIGVCQELQRAVGKLLAPKVSDLSLMDVTSTQRILEFGAHEPPELFDALNCKVWRLIDEEDGTPPLDLFSVLFPGAIRSWEEQQRLSSYLNEYLDMFPDFWQMYPSAFRVLRGTTRRRGERVRCELFDKFWGKAEKLLLLEAGDPAKVLKIAYDYFSINCGGLHHTSRCIQLESRIKQLLYFYISNYKQQRQPTLISPSDFAKAYAFLIAFGWHADSIFQEGSAGLWRMFQEKFTNGIRPLSVFILARGIALSLNGQSQSQSANMSQRYFDQIQNFTRSLEVAVEQFVLGDRRDELCPDDLNLLARAQVTLKKASAESAIFTNTLSLICSRANIRALDSKQAKDLVTGLSASNYNDPAITALLVNFVKQNGASISPEFAGRFLCHAYNVGIELHDPDDSAMFQAAYDVIYRYWDRIPSIALLQSSLMLSLAQCLHPPLVHNLFTTDFIDKLDEEAKSPATNSYTGQTLRRLYMELNRAVCLDVPDANVPWFHQKYCESIFSTLPFKESPLETEVLGSLVEVLLDENVIQRGVVSPYFYQMEFLIEFDESGKPLKSGKGKRLLSSLQSLRKGPNTGSKGSETQSVAILILPPGAFSTNFRSLRGYFQLRKRHLEILGFRVVHIDPQHWNAMHMTDIKRAEYLENALFPKGYRSPPPPRASPLNFDLIHS